jgi:uncharacterized protein (TIGR03000 family)
VLEVHVPAAARVFVNGQLTKSTGEVRRYVSRDLVPGASYNYEVRAELPGGAPLLTETKAVKLTAGARQQLSFALSNPVATSLPTSLTLHVPSDAKVTLGGNPTVATGARRVYESNLPAGQRYDQYQVRVELSQNGRTLTREKTISISAGERQELTIDFGSTSSSPVALTAAN